MSTTSLRVGIDVRLAHWPGIGRYIEETVAHLVADFPATEFVLFGNAGVTTTLRAYADPQLQHRLRAPNARFVDLRRSTVHGSRTAGAGAGW